MKDIYQLYAKHHSEFTIDDINNLSKELDSVIYFDAIFEFSVRVNRDLFVSKDTLIGELLQIDSGVGYILMGIGMHCFGCPASQMETIEEAAMVHGLDVDDLMGAINSFSA